LPPSLHQTKFPNVPVWVFIKITELDMCLNVVYPQNQPFLREENLREDGSVLKRVIKEGSSELLPENWEIWIRYEGRLENGYEFNKPRSTVCVSNGKTYSVAWMLAFQTMKRGEIA